MGKALNCNSMLSLKLAFEAFNDLKNIPHYVIHISLML